MANNKHPGSNPVLAAFAKQLEENYLQRLDATSELDMIAMMKTVHEELGVGPGRAGRVFFAYQRNKEELAKAIRDDYGDKKTGDKNILHTKATYTEYLRGVFGPETWEKVKIFFQLLRDYW